MAIFELLSPKSPANAVAEVLDCVCLERREAIRRGIGGLAHTLIKTPQVPVGQPSAVKASAEGFYEAREEANLAQYWGDHNRAH